MKENTPIAQNLRQEISSIDDQSRNEYCDTMLAEMAATGESDDTGHSPAVLLLISTYVH